MKEKSLSERKNKIGINKIISNIAEIIKSKTNKNYTLSYDSPEILRRNRKMILRTLKTNPYFLDAVPENILLEEMRQQELSSSEIINTAFMRGYKLNEESSPILLGEHAKGTLLEYIDINRSSGNLSEISYIDEIVLSDSDFKKKMLDLLVESNYKINNTSPDYLKEDIRLVEIYYKDMLENNPERIKNDEENILNSNLVGNQDFLKKYINLLKQNGIKDETIVSSLTYSQECIDVLKSDLGLFQTMFEAVSVEKLDDFFNIFYSSEEIENLLKSSDGLEGKLQRLSNLYAKDRNILHTLNGRLLEEKYKDIPDYKMQLFAENPKFQERLVRLNDFEFSLYSKMTQLVSRKTDRWNRFDENIVDNFTDGYYYNGDLINDLYIQSKNGDKITAKDMEVLTFIFSHDVSPISQHNQITDNIYPNFFNITTKKELEHFEEIKELVCDTILENPSMEDRKLIDPICKYCKGFAYLSESDRVKMALLQKYYNMSLDEASEIIEKFGTDIDNIPNVDERQADIIEQIKAIRNIIECEDRDALRQIGNLDLIVQTDLSTSTYLTEEAKEMFEQIYKKDLYMPKEEEKMGEVDYDGQKIAVFDANIDFKMIVKLIGLKKENSQDIWNNMVKEAERESVLRYRTSTSYMTDETLFKRNRTSSVTEPQILLGFSQGTNGYSFDDIFSHDAQTPFLSNDEIYCSRNDSRYTTPSTMEMNTDFEYNEIVINTLKTNEQGHMEKMQPDYIVYIKDKSNMGLEELEEDSTFEASKRVASEFGIPIVIIDREKIRESEKSKIASRSKKGLNELEKYIKKVEHYKQRYGDEEILDYAPKDTIDYYKGFIEKKKDKPNTTLDFKKIKEDTQQIDTRQDIVKRQEDLNTVINGDER